MSKREGINKINITFKNKKIAKIFKRIKLKSNQNLIFPKNTKKTTIKNKFPNLSKIKLHKWMMKIGYLSNQISY